MKKLPSQERLKELFDYDPETGIVTRKIPTSNRTKAGDIVGSINKSGYFTVHIDIGAYYIHRVIWKMENGNRGRP